MVKFEMKVLSRNIIIFFTLFNVRIVIIYHEIVCMQRQYLYCNLVCFFIYIMTINMNLHYYSYIYIIHSPFDYSYPLIVEYSKPSQTIKYSISYKIYYLAYTQIYSK